jgi:hypothetical protein
MGDQNITAAEVCELVPAADVGEALGIRLTRAKPEDINTARLATSVLCRYQGEPELGSFSMVSVSVELWRAKLAEGDFVKAAFTAADGTPVEYETVDDLGDAAGFGPTPYFRDQYQLTVVNEYSDGHRELTVETDIGKKPTADQLRRVAEPVLQKLDG